MMQTEGSFPFCIPAGRAGGEVHKRPGKAAEHCNFTGVFLRRFGAASCS